MTQRTQLAIALSLVVVFWARAQQTALTENHTPRATPAGATFTVPAGWTTTTKGPAVIAIVDVNAKDADVAVAAGWAVHPAAVAKLAGSYKSAQLGTLAVHKDGVARAFDVGEWRSTLASRRNDDGTTSFITIDPTIAGFELVVADKDARRRFRSADPVPSRAGLGGGSPGASRQKTKNVP